MTEATYVHTVTAITITPAELCNGGSRLLTEQATIVELVDEGGGPFVLVGTADALDSDRLRFEVEELEEVAKAARQLVSQVYKLPSQEAKQ